MLKQRVITAIVLVIVFLGVLLGLPAVFLAAFFAVAVLFGAWEWSMLSGLESKPARIAYVGAIAALLVGLANWCQLGGETLNLLRVRDVVGLGCTWWALALLLVKFYPASAQLWGSAPVRLILGVVTLVPAWLALVALRWQNDGVDWLLVLVAVVASADIGAYFSGRAWGRAKLAPNVSPGKSWAGFWGGLLAAVLVSSGLWWLAGQPFSYFAAVVVAIFTVAGSVLGDLSESMVKRHRGVKDSGNILPGHGGILDRIDSLTAAAPVLALSIILLGW